MNESKFSLTGWHEIKKDGTILTVYEVVDCLNNQEAIINALKKENKELKKDLGKGSNVPIPYVENSVRRWKAEKKVKEQQAFIDRLQRENEELMEYYEELLYNGDS